MLRIELTREKFSPLKIVQRTVKVKYIELKYVCGSTFFVNDLEYLNTQKIRRTRSKFGELARGYSFYGCCMHESMRSQC